MFFEGWKLVFLRFTCFLPLINILKLKDSFVAQLSQNLSKSNFMVFQCHGRCINRSLNVRNSYIISFINEWMQYLYSLSVFVKTLLLLRSKQDHSYAASRFEYSGHECQQV